MDLLIFLILYVLCIILTLLLSYYKRLFSENRNEYSREELMGFRHIIETEGKKFFSTGEHPIIYYAFAAGMLVGFFVSYMGGLYGAHYESIFFHSGIIPLALFFLLPKVKESLINDESEGLFWQKLLQCDMALFTGFGLSIIAKTLMVYGVYHAISFLWVIVNVVAIFVLILLRMWVDEGVIGSPKDLFRKPEK